MKRLSLIFTLSIVLLSFGLANAILFEVEVDPTKQFTHPDSPYGTYYMGNTPVFLNLKMANNDGIDHTGFSQTHKFYSTNGIGTPITWIDAGGEAQAWDDPPGGVPSILGMNGWLDDTPLPGDDGYFGMMAQLTVFSWDGSLPDTMNFTTASMTGWLGTNTTMETRYQFHFSVPTSGSDQSTDVVEICIDQSNGGHPDFDWLFPIAVPFGGPYCFEFLTVPNLPPVIDPAPPLSMTKQHHESFEFTGTLDDPEDNPVTDVQASIGDVTFTSGDGSFTWSLAGDCDWVDDGLSHSVTFTLYDDVNGHMPGTNTYTMDLVTENTEPTIDAGCDGSQIIPFNNTKCLSFTASDANVGDPLVWSYAFTGSVPTGPVTTSTTVDLDGNSTFEICFTPNQADAEVIPPDYPFTVTVTDCADEFATCAGFFGVVSEVRFGVYIELEDGNNIYESDAKTFDPFDDALGIGVMDGDGAYQGQHSNVSVILAEGSEELHAFDLMIAYDNSALGFVAAYPNEFVFGIDTPDPDDYEWEYFTYRFGDNCGGVCPSGLLKVIGIADQNDGLHHPRMVWNASLMEYRIAVITKPQELFYMDFMVSNDYTLECNFVPISFFWTDCTDNSLAFTYTTGDKFEVFQGVSDTVFNFSGYGYEAIAYYPDLHGDEAFPTYYGAPQGACIDDQGSHTEPKAEPIRWVNFYNGGIKIICLEDYDDRGDINLNGIANEIADAVVFTNYFIYGLSAFTEGDGQGQMAATDVNADGIILSVADLVYLVRIITGDILMIPDKLNPNMVEAHFGHDGQLVTVDVELGAALFVLEGEADVNLAQGAAHMDLKSGIVDGNTHVLVYSFDKGATFSGNILNTEGRLISIESADYNGSAYKTIALPTSFSVENYPNPFNAATTISMALPVATNWNLTIYNVAGQKVAEFSGFAEAGINDVVWNDKTAASGIYFYKVSTDSGSMTKKMVLLK